MKKLIFLFFIITTSLVSQERKTLYGKVLDSIGSIRDANIINLNTNQGTYTNEYGDFRIFAKIGDSLKITSIQYETKIYKVNKVSFGFNDVHVFLKRKTYQLDEVVIKNTDLLGSLDLDTKKTPADRRADALEKLMDFSDIDMSVELNNDHINEKVRPPVVNTVPNSFGGAGASVSIPFGYSKKLWELRKKLAFKKSFPTRIFNDFGEKFFFKELKIPVERYYHFLEYCNPLGIEDLYKKGNKLKVIKILKQEHTEYLKLIKKE